MSLFQFIRQFKYPTSAHRCRKFPSIFNFGNKCPLLSYDKGYIVRKQFKSNMPKLSAKGKAKGEEKSKSKHEAKQEKQTCAAPQPISLNPDNSLLIQILAKPGAKQNSITGISSDGIGVQISAPPVDGEANAVLLRYIASVLEIRKSAISLEKGNRSRTKVLLVESSAGLSVEYVEQKLASELS